MRTVKVTLLVTSEYVQMTGCYQNNKTKDEVPRHVGD
jgi:hypothetical protein